jgi:hypothetical protein
MVSIRANGEPYRGFLASSCRFRRERDLRVAD